MQANYYRALRCKQLIFEQIIRVKQRVIGRERWENPLLYTCHKHCDMHRNTYLPCLLAHLGESGQERGECLGGRNVCVWGGRGWV